MFAILSAEQGLILHILSYLEREEGHSDVVQPQVVQPEEVQTQEDQPQEDPPDTYDPVAFRALSPESYFPPYTASRSLNPQKFYPQYAVISRYWQYAVERETFSSINLRSDELERFSQMFEHPHRRAALGLHRDSHPWR